MGMVPKKTKADNRIWHSLTLRLIGFGLLVLLMSFEFAKLVLPDGITQILFTIFALVVYVICNLPSPTDPNRIFILGLYDYLHFKFVPKDMYGDDSEEYKTYKKDQEIKNEKSYKKKNRKKR